MLPKHDEIEEARATILTLFADQVRKSEASKTVRQSHGDVYVCGQFLRSPERGQRGLHGTTAALHVLAKSDDERHRDLISGLIRYIQHRPQIELALESRTQAVLDAEKKNVLKIAEAVVALNRVPAASGGGAATSYARQLAEPLMHELRDRGGIGFFLGDATTETLPTAAAILAVHSLGWSAEIQSARTALLNSLSKNDKSSLDFPDAAFAIHVLATTSSAKHSEKTKLQAALRTLWRRVEPLMTPPFEHNVEYWEGERNFYARVPWQLYILSAAAQLRVYRVLLSHQATELTKLIVQQAKGEGFIYPHSGTVPSARTNAVVYSLLGTLLNAHPVPLLSSTHYFYDRLRTSLGSPWIGYMGLAVAAVIICWSTYLWIQKGGSADDLFPEFGGAVVLSLVSLRKTRTP